MVEMASIALKRLLLETWLLKVIPLSAQMEIKNILLKAGGKVILVVKW